MPKTKKEKADEKKQKQQETVETAETEKKEEAVKPEETAENNAGNVPEADEKDVKIAQLEDQIKAEKEKLLRTAAEYANFRSRTDREKAAIYGNAVSDTITELLPIADSIDRALEVSKDAPEEFKKGLELISNQLKKTFEKLNITAFGEVGEEFNPELHNAISSVDNEELESDTIAAVYQRGYKVGDKIIRHCMVQTVN